MKNVRIITRSDDAGSSHSANIAITRVIQAGFMKNVSLMAVGDYIEEAALLCAGAENICFGMHATLNAEWDHVKWSPLTRLTKACGLVDDDGFFLSHPNMFKDTKPSVDTVIGEYDMQLSRLKELGFKITYVDSHMFAEYHIDGMIDAMSEWAKKNDLLCHLNYLTATQNIHMKYNQQDLLSAISSLQNGQYLVVSHPSLYTDEMLKTGNAEISGRETARTRNMETELFSDIPFIQSLYSMGIQTIRYDEASPDMPV